MEHFQAGEDIFFCQSGFRFGFGDGEQPGQIPLLRFQLLKSCLGGCGKNACLDGGYQIGNGSVDIRKLELKRFDAAVGYTLVLIGNGGFGQILNGLICQHGIPQRGCDKGFDCIPAYISFRTAFMVSAAAFTGIVIMGCICMAGAGDPNHRFLTMAAEELSGEQVCTAFPAATLGCCAGGILAGVILAVCDGLNLVKLLLGYDCGNSAGDDDFLRSGTDRYSARCSGFC